MEMNQAQLMELQHKYIELAFPKENHNHRKSKAKIPSGGEGLKQWQKNSKM